MGRWGDGEMGRWGDGENGREGDKGDKGDKGEFLNSTLNIPHLTLPSTLNT
ncbi:MAG: hypothetical protein KME17_11855 [Cyanosarcina radialis HA8281-LM2]|nr:hypothetical protein [Cyanosarcina radialis HA8281-LM2]